MSTTTTERLTRFRGEANRDVTSRDYEHLYRVTTSAPEYVTIADAAAAMGIQPWRVVELVEREEIRGVRFGAKLLVNVYDVETLGGAL